MSKTKSESRNERLNKRERAVQEMLGYVQLFDTGLIEVSRFMDDDWQYVVIAVDKRTNDWLMSAACKNRQESESKFAEYSRIAIARHNARIANMIAVHA